MNYDKTIYFYNNDLDLVNFLCINVSKFIYNVLQLSSKDFRLPYMDTESFLNIIFSDVGIDIGCVDSDFFISEFSIILTKTIINLLASLVMI